MKPEILTHSGKYFDFLNPDPANINLKDIAWGLSNTCRFAGQTKQFYSVAQHCCYAAKLVVDYGVKNGLDTKVINQLAFQALMHDAAEAYLGDIPSPLKQLLPDYKKLEKIAERAIFNRFGIPLELDLLVKKVDMELLVTEAAQLMPPHSDTWQVQKQYKELEILIKPESPSNAYVNFVDWFNWLYVY